MDFTDFIERTLSMSEYFAASESNSTAVVSLTEHWLSCIYRKD